MSGPFAKSIPVCVKAAAAPTPDQLAAIRKYTLRDFQPEELVVRTFILAHNGIDRDNECFDEQLLADFQNTISGKGCYILHPSSWSSDGGPAEGRVFGADLQTMSFDAARELLRAPNLQFPPDRTKAKVLTTDVFFVRTPDNQSLLMKMDAGIAGDVSIGFSYESREALKDADGRELTARRLLGPGEALEQSLVWLGAQPGARAIKHANRNQQETDMDHADKIKALETENANLKAAQAANAKAAEQMGALRKALGDNADADALLAAPAKLAAHVADGVKYHATLVDNIVTAERHLKLCGDEPDAVTEAKELYAGFPVAKLEKTLAALEARSAPARSAVKGGDPNNTAPGGFQKNAPGAGDEKQSPLANPALAG